jgi:hypothetical protein
MLAKVFEGKPKTVEKNLNEWLGDVKPVVKHVASAVFKSGVLYTTVLYDEPRKRQERVRGPEKPGEAPVCVCGKTMVRRERKADGEPFWGCVGFPECRNVVNFDEADREAERRATSPDEPEFGGQGGYYDPDDDDIPF